MNGKIGRQVPTIPLLCFLIIFSSESPLMSRRDKSVGHRPAPRTPSSRRRASSLTRIHITSFGHISGTRLNRPAGCTLLPCRRKVCAARWELCVNAISDSENGDLGRLAACRPINDVATTRQRRTQLTQSGRIASTGCAGGARRNRVGASEWVMRWMANGNSRSHAEAQSRGGTAGSQRPSAQCNPACPSGQGAATETAWDIGLRRPA